MSEPRPVTRLAPPLLGLGLGLAVAVGVAVPGCLDPREEQLAPEEARCATCHGDPARAGDFMRRAAPPADLVGGRDPSFRGVGAHSIHLDGSSTHGPIACTECHVVPTTVLEEGHADTPRPASVELGPIARTGDRQPAYDPLTRRCSDTHCHREADAVWNAPRPPEGACGSCHGLPPPAPHPAAADCSTCHGSVIDGDRRFVDPARHVDGTVDVSVPDQGCTLCHGSGSQPAPPRDTSGGADRSARGVGAHREHLDGARSRPLECGECHTVPATVDAPSHMDDPPAEVTLVGVATTGDHAAAAWDPSSVTCSDTWCHGPSPGTAAASPPWTSDAALSCSGCHGEPPAAPHPQMANCSACHADVASDDRTIVDPSLHVNGAVEVRVPNTCTACHGSAGPAPPPDLDGNTDRALPSVGAHAAHVDGGAWARPVPCSDCHVPPSSVLATGHMDTPPPAEVVLSGAASAFGGSPAYAEGACTDTSCHGAVFPEGHRSGGTLTTPKWTSVDGGAAQCGACHGLPPPAPHPYGDLNPVCSACHEDIARDNVTFLRPDLHVDGQVTFTVP